MRHEIHIPDFHPTRLNRLMRNRWVASKAKNGDLELIDHYGRDVPKATSKRRISLIITLGPRQRAADPDAYWKSSLDALKRCGLLIDDNRQHVELVPPEFVRGPRRATTIIIEDIA